MFTLSIWHLGLGNWAQSFRHWNWGRVAVLWISSLSDVIGLSRHHAAAVGACIHITCPASHRSHTVTWSDWSLCIQYNMPRRQFCTACHTPRQCRRFAQQKALRRCRSDVPAPVPSDSAASGDQVARSSNSAQLVKIADNRCHVYQEIFITWEPAWKGSIWYTL